MKFQRYAIAIGIVALCVGGYVAVNPQPPQTDGITTKAPTRAAYTKDEELVLPADWRTWVFAGTSVPPNDMNEGKALFPDFDHNYTSPETHAAAKNTGKSPEGAVRPFQTTSEMRRVCAALRTQALKVYKKIDGHQLRLCTGFA